jgi:hypothetical protein
MPLTTFASDEGVSYHWLRHRLDWFNWTRSSDGRLYVDPDEVRAYLAKFTQLPASALAELDKVGEQPSRLANVAGATR